MKATKRLILGLRETAAQLRGKESGYNWCESEHCNCGMLAKNLGLPSAPLKAMQTSSWSAMAGQNDYYCHSAGRSMTEVFDFLLAAGLERTDFFAVEWLDGNDRSDYCDPLAVAAWMDAKADELERRRSAEQRGERSEA